MKSKHAPRTQEVRGTLGQIGIKTEKKQVKTTKRLHLLNTLTAKPY